MKQAFRSYVQNFTLEAGCLVLIQLVTRYLGTEELKLKQLQAMGTVILRKKKSPAKVKKE